MGDKDLGDRPSLLVLDMVLELVVLLDGDDGKMFLRRQHCFFLDTELGWNSLRPKISGIFLCYDTFRLLTSWCFEECMLRYQCMRLDLVVGTKISTLCFIRTNTSAWRPRKESVRIRSRSKRDRFRWPRTRHERAFRLSSAFDQVPPITKRETIDAHLGSRGTWNKISITFSENRT